MYLKSFQVASWRIIYKITEDNKIFNILIVWDDKLNYGISALSGGNDNPIKEEFF